MIRNSQYGRTDDSTKKLNLDDSEENLLTVRKILSESDICHAICDIKNLTENIEKVIFYTFYAIISYNNF